MANFDLRNQQVDTQYIAGRDIAIYQQVVPLTLTDAQQKRNRTAMLNRVHSYWIKGVLEQSLSKTNLVLGLREQSDSVTHSLYLDPERSGQSLRALPPGLSLFQAYSDGDNELLLLGEPGSGKTTLLLELARDLLGRATNDETQPIPVIFNLSSWALKRQPLSLWLVEELGRMYLVPRKLAVSWVANDQILPLLDGLDEVAAVHRVDCVEAINTYHREHGLVPLIVSCRSADYAALPKRLQLGRTITVQPLTMQQIDDYLAGVGEQADALRRVLRNDPVLQELVTTPLLLSILMLAYQDKRVEDLISADAPAVQRQRVLANYVERMLQQKGQKMRYQQSQVLRWLGWLAQQLALHNQTEFSIERLQPDWLLERQAQRFYDRLGVRLPGVLFGAAVTPIVWIASSSIDDNGIPASHYYIFLMMFIGGLIGGLFSNAPRQRLGRTLITALILGVVITFVATLFYQLNEPSTPWDWVQTLSGGCMLGCGSFVLALLVLSGFVGNVKTEIQRVPVALGSFKSLWSPLLKAGHLKNGIAVGLIYGLVFWLDGLLGLAGFPAFGGLLYGLILGISVIVLSVVLGARGSAIQPVEVLVWSWSDFKHSLTDLKHLRNGALIGAACGCVCGLSGLLGDGPDTPLSAVLRDGLAYAIGDGIAVGLSYWFFVALLQGVSGAILDERLHLLPNQGIRRSGRNGLFMGLIGAGVIGICAFLALLLRHVLSDPHNVIDSSAITNVLVFALTVGLAGGLIAGLLNGWLAVIRHGVLRVLLLWAGVTPFNYPGFLDEAAAHVLLRKVGGSYIFIHQLLLDYFATIEFQPASGR